MHPGGATNLLENYLFPDFEKLIINLILKIQVARNARRPKKTFKVNKALKHLQQEIMVEIKHTTV